MRWVVFLGFLLCCYQAVAQEGEFEVFLHPPGEIKTSQLSEMKKQLTADVVKSGKQSERIGIDTNAPEIKSFDGKSFHEVVERLSVMHHIESDLVSQHQLSVSHKKPEIFRGEVARCHRLVHVPLSKSCCSMDIKHHGLHINACPQSAYELAAARRAGRVHFVGKYCAKHLRAGVKTCLKEVYVFCRYSSVLSRLVQEAGREQINAMVAGKIGNRQHNVRYQVVHWSYQALDAQWHRFSVGDQALAVWQWPVMQQNRVPVNVKLLSGSQSGVIWHIKNGDFVWQLGPKTELAGHGHCDAQQCRYRLSLKQLGQEYKGQWSFPPDCHQVSPWRKQLGTVTLTPMCTPKHLVMAICQRGKLCGDLPKRPDLSSKIKQGWQIRRFPKATHGWLPIDHQLAMWGACMNGQCDFKFRALGQSGVLDTVEKETSWSLFSDAVIAWQGIQIQPVPVNNLETSKFIDVNLKLSGHAGRVLKLPIDIPANQPMIVSASPWLKVWGGCDVGSRLCRYHWIYRLPIHAIHWGSVHHPNCRGFTPEEFALINWQQMHLGRYSDQIATKRLDQKAMQASAASTAENFPEMIDSGAKLPVSQPNTQSYSPMRLFPLEGRGQFMETAILTSYWPRYVAGKAVVRDPAHQVTAVKIYWGDGTMRQVARAHLRTINHVPVFVVKHLYDPPDGFSDGFSGAHTQIMHVMAVFYTQAGTFVATGDIANVWNAPIEGQNLGASTEKLRWVVPTFQQKR